MIFETMAEIRRKLSGDRRPRFIQVLRALCCLTASIFSFRFERAILLLANEESAIPTGKNGKATHETRISRAKKKRTKAQQGGT